MLQPSKRNKDAIHWLTGPITVDLGRENMKTYADLVCLTTSGPAWMKVHPVKSKNDHFWSALMEIKALLNNKKGTERNGFCMFYFLLWPLHCIEWSLNLILSSPAVCPWSFVYCRSCLNAQLCPQESPCLLFTPHWLTMKPEVQTHSLSSIGGGGVDVDMRRENDPRGPRWWCI